MQVQAQGCSVKWKSASTQAQAQAQLRCNFYPIEVGASDLFTTSTRTQGLYPSPPTTTEGRERNTGYEVDLARH